MNLLRGGRLLWASFPVLLAMPQGPRCVGDLTMLEHILNRLQVTVLTLELMSPTLPAGKAISFDLSNPARVAELKKTPITIKEGVEYKCVLMTNITFRC